MAKLTKNLLLNGFAEKKTFKLKSMADAEVELRYLSQSEINKYEELSTEKLGNLTLREIRGKQESSNKINISELTKGNHEAEAYLLATALSIQGGESYSPDDVLTLQSSVFKELWTHVKEMNGLDSPEKVEQEVKQFHKRK